MAQNRDTLSTIVDVLQIIKNTAKITKLLSDYSSVHGVANTVKDMTAGAVSIGLGVLVTTAIMSAFVGTIGAVCAIIAGVAVTTAALASYSAAFIQGRPTLEELKQQEGKSTGTPCHSM